MRLFFCAMVQEQPVSKPSHSGRLSCDQFTLIQTLLERDGLLSRKVYPVIPPKVEYRVTPLRRGLLVPVTGICGWVGTELA